MNDSQINVDSKDAQGKTPLHHAAADKAHQKAVLLLANGADSTPRMSMATLPWTKQSGAMPLKQLRYCMRTTIKTGSLVVMFSTFQTALRVGRAPTESGITPKCKYDLR